MEIELERIDTPIGTVEVAVADDALVAIDFADCRDRMEMLLSQRFGAVSLSERAGNSRLGESVRRYFAGSLAALNDVSINPGGTRFQRSVWEALRRVPAGRTATYGEIATAIGRPDAARAVGAANSRNPVALAIPCHRIVGADGSLTGYAGGLSRKRWLLAHEGVSLT